MTFLRCVSQMASEHSYLIHCIIDNIIYYMDVSQLLPNGRWLLLRALWSDGAEGSVRSLARQNRLSYSSAHAELKRLEHAGLARSTLMGNSLVYRANRSHPDADAMDRLVRAATDRSPTPADDPEPAQVLAHLKALGAPVREATEPAVRLTPEEAVARGLRLAHNDPALARSFPVLLARNRGRLDMERLRQRATALGEKQSLGFFLDLTAQLAGDRELETLAHTLRDRRVRRTKNFFHGVEGKHARHLSELRTPPVARDWKFRMDMDMENFRQLYRKFLGAE